MNSSFTRLSNSERCATMPYVTIPLLPSTQHTQGQSIANMYSVVRSLLCAVVISVNCAVAFAGIAAPTFQELMKPEMFPHAQYGMSVESAVESPGAIDIMTTGAVFHFNTARGTVTVSQRIGHSRPLAVLRLDEPLEGARIAQKTDGLVMIEIAKPNVTIRVNCDSLLMLHVHEAVNANVGCKIIPAWHDYDKTYHLIADEWGAFGLYCSNNELNDNFDLFKETIATYQLPSDAVLWLGACPPKPYNWEKSLKDNVVWHWSDKNSYPPNESFRRWKDYGNIMLLQGEMMLWKDWQLAFEPRLGMAEFERVRNAAHKNGMRLMVYTSPAYFLKGSPNELLAINEWGGKIYSDCSGMNMELFMDAVTGVMKDLKPDGLYYDMAYVNSPAASYALMRRSRELLGDDGILEWHSTDALGVTRHSACYLPHADVYADYILRGEARQDVYSNRDYLRFFVSGYNINNCIGVLCNNGKPEETTVKVVDGLLAVNCRLHTLIRDIENPDKTALMHYRKSLTADIRALVTKDIDTRQMQVAEKFAALKAADNLDKAERAALRKASLSQPKIALRRTFDLMPDDPQVASNDNVNPFSIVDGKLQIRAKHKTYAFLRIPADEATNGLAVNIKMRYEKGAAWGPCIQLRWQDGIAMTIGIRSDKVFQVNYAGKELLCGSFDPDKWLWVRVRWLTRNGILEYSADGVNYTEAYSFPREGRLGGPLAEVRLGKVFVNGEAVDYNDALGDVGTCEIDEFELYKAE